MRVLRANLRTLMNDNREGSGPGYLLLLGPRSVHPACRVFLTLRAFYLKMVAFDTHATVLTFTVLSENVSVCNGFCAPFKACFQLV